MADKQIMPGLNRVALSDRLEVSRIIQGQMRLLEWGFSNQELFQFIEECIALGVTTFDHADIYGDYECERKFGEPLKLDSSLRENIEIVTKCGIRLLSDKFPDRTIKYYDYNSNYIISSAEASLRNLNTDRIDLFLLHRPSPLLEPEEVAKAFGKLHKEGKVLSFGVSNFLPHQFEALQKHLDEKLVTNQVEISPYNLEHFDNGNMDFFLKENISPMAWSPLAGGSVFNPQTEKDRRLELALKEVAGQLGAEHIDSVIYAWLFKHPANILPIVGSGKIERIRTAVEALKLTMSDEQWFKICVASTGKSVA